MAKKKVGIIAECVCDLPSGIIEEYDISLVYFLVETDSGVFTDTDEITAENIFAYLETGGTKSKSPPPSKKVYIQAFRKKLQKYEEVFLPTISSGVSESYKIASEAVEEMGEEGKHVHIFDTGHLSTGLGHMIIRAAGLAREGKDIETITEYLSDMKDMVSTSFITMNLDYLYRNGFVNKAVKNICDVLKAHPVLELVDGKMTVQSIKFGNYDKACIRYINKQLKKHKSIDKTRAFITHANLPARNIETLKKHIAKLCEFNEIIVTPASATVSSNCGPGSVGILFVENKI